MKAAMFRAVCPLELGDRVAVEEKDRQKPGTPKTAYYLPDGAAVMVKGIVTIHTVTDILTLHFLKDGNVSFLYELDGRKKYEPLEIFVPGQKKPYKAHKK